MFSRPLSLKLLGTFVAGAVCVLPAGRVAASPVLPGLAVHLRADQVVVNGSGNVLQWTDLSGNGLHATPLGTAPVQVLNQINGLPVVRFGGGDRRLNLPNMGPVGDYEVFIVARSTTAGVQFLASSATLEHFEAHLNGASGVRFIPRTGAYSDLGAVNQFTNGQPHAFNFRVENNTGYNRANGIQSDSTLLAARSTANALLSLGIRAGQNNYPFVGDMAEVLIYDRALTAAERGQVDAYLISTWGSPYPIVLAPTSGHSISWNGVSGPQTAANAVPNNLALRPEVFAFGSSEHPASAHAVAHINDGMYGNSNSWLANEGSDPNPYIGLDLGGLKMIDSIAWGRSNTLSHTDRWQGTYTLQYTQAVGQDIATLAETGNARTGWVDLGAVTLTPNLSAANGALRHQFDLGAVVATGVRIKPSSNQLAIDELELYGAASYPEAVTYHGARGYWKLDDPASGPAVVNSGLAGSSLDAQFRVGAYPGSSTNKIAADGLVFGTRGPNDAAHFNGADPTEANRRWAQGSGIATAGSAGGNVFAGDWTIEAWFVRDAVTRAGTIFSNNVNADGSPILMFFDAQSVPGTEHTIGIMNTGTSWANPIGIDLAGADYLGKPVYAVMTKTGGNASGQGRVSLYVNVDGTWYTELDQPVLWPLTPGDGFLIGRHYAGFPFNFDGTIDDVAIYDYALDFDAIRAHYAMGVPEPNVALLLAAALVGLAAARRRKR